MGEVYGYIRVSTKEQNTDRQIEHIKKHFPNIKMENMFIEKVSGKKDVDERTEYSILRRVVRSGDELVVDSLDTCIYSIAWYWWTHWRSTGAEMGGL